MRSDFKITSLVLLFCCTFLLIASCKNDNDEEKEDDDAKTEAKEPAAVAVMTGKLDTLYIDRRAFDTIGGNRKIAFSFVFTAPDTVTLVGWLLKGTKYDDLPNMQLKNSTSTSHTFGIGTYFGDVIIGPQDFNKIKTALINQTMNYVLFAPVPQGNNIKYQILVSDKISESKETILVVVVTGADANPSPPKNS